MVASFRDSLDAWLERILPADVYVRAASGGETAYLPPEAQARIAALPGVRRAEFLREQQLLLDPARPRIVLQARAVDPADPARNAADRRHAARCRGGCAAAGLGERSRGRPLRIRAGTRHRVADRRQDASASPSPASGATTRGSRARSRWSAQRYIALTGDRTVTNGALWLAEGAEPPAVEEAIRRDIPGGDRLEIFAPGEIRSLSLQAFDRTFAVTYALELAARRHRARRPLVVVRRAGARAAARVRRAAPPRDDATADRRDARDRRARGQRHRARGRAWRSASRSASS